MRRRYRRWPITARITAGFVCAMAVLLALTGAFVYERMSYALNRSITDVPSTDRVEISARIRHRNEALNELLGQLAVAFAGSLLISGYVGHRVARAALDPVERMRRRAGEESADAFFRLPVPDTRDELTRLAETLNDLLARIESGVVRERRLIADASHELRTPLTQMLLRLDLALSRERAPGELKATLEELHDDTERLVRLANDLLLIARADEGKLPLRVEPVPVLDVASESAHRFESAAAGQGRSVEVEVDPGLELPADRDRLGQALDNLISNAIEHGEGTVSVTADAGVDAVTIRVCDEGPGLPDAFAGQAFDRFTTASQSRSGTGMGLGLAIVAAIATAHGGTVRIGGGPGGSVVLTLPAERRPSALDTATAAS
jgi:signal transduction histidine kinase